MLYVFSTCREFIRTMPTLQYSRTYPEDVDSDMEDHIADETRYLCMMVPMRAETPKGRASVQIYDPLDRPVSGYPARAEQREEHKKEKK